MLDGQLRVVTDDFWARVEPLVPIRERTADKEYARKAGGGRKPKPARLVFEAVVYVLRTGCQWKALPKERFGSASSIHKRFLEWERAGVFEAIWPASHKVRRRRALPYLEILLRPRNMPDWTVARSMPQNFRNCR